MIDSSVLIWSVGQWVGGSVEDLSVGRWSVIGGLVVGGRWVSGDPAGVSVVGCQWLELL